MKKSYKLILTLLLVLVVFTGLSAVSAADVNTSDASSSIGSVNTNTQTSDLLTGADYSNYQTSVDNSSEYSNEYSSNLNDVAVLSDGNTTTSNAGSYTDLANLINNSNGTISLEHNYAFNTDLDTNYINGINITHNLVINGNGYTINANYQPGIFNILNSTVTLNDLNLINDKSTSGNYSGGAIGSENSNIFINNCNFTNNYENSRGGAIYVYLCNLTVTNSTFTNNTASNYGGAIASDNSNVTVNECEFINNIVNTPEINRTGIHGGGAIATSASQVLINNCYFDSNIATGNDAITYAGEGGAILLHNTTCFVNNSGFTNNSASAAAGAIWSWYNTLTINNTVFTNNTSKRNGGAVLVDGNLYVYDSIFRNNLVNSTNPLTGFYYGGGAIYQYNGELTLDDSSFVSNVATGDLNDSGNGGAIATNGTLNVTECDFNNNVANIGGAIATNNNLSIDNSEFYGNIANLYGGAVGTYYNIMVFNSNFTQNNAGILGGAILAYKNSFIVACDFINNTADYSGGAVYAHNNGTVISSNFQNNTAKYGGAVSTDDNAVVAYSNFTFNNAKVSGGAIYSDNNVMVTDSGLGLNTAKNGGAIMAHRVNVTKTYFIKNFASNEGGAVYAQNATVNYCVLLHNNGNTSSIAYEGDYCNANYNWWGNNTPFNGTDYNDLIYHEINSTSKEYVKADNWVLMTLTVNSTNVTLGDIIKATVDFTHYTDGNNTYNMTSLIPELPVKLSSNDEFNSTITKFTQDNVARFGYHTKNTGNFTTTVYAPYQTLTYNFTVNALTNKSTVLDTPMDYYVYGNNTYNGTLLDSNGNPVAYRTVSLNLTRISTGAWKVYNVTTNIYGEYSLPITLAPGRYIVKGSFAGDNDYDGSTDNGYIGIRTGHINVNNINATYGDNISLTGYVYDSNNNPLVNKTITISLLRTATGQWKFYYVNTDSEGKYSLPIHLSPGTYFEDSFYNDATNIRYVSFIVINNGTSDNRVPTSTILMDTNTNTIYGYLLGENNHLIPNANITLEFTRLSNGASKNYTVTTDNTGNFIFPTVLSGDFKVVASYNGTSIYQPSKFVGYTTF